MSQSTQSPFNLHCDDSYLQWRKKKLTIASKKQTTHRLILKKTPPTFSTLFQSSRTNNACKQLLLDDCASTNSFLYSIENHSEYNASETKHIIQAFLKQCGLSDYDKTMTSANQGLSEIHQTTHVGQHAYIPYTNKPLSWHTDGYYNSPDEQIHSMLLHCFQAATSGGESAFLDHDIAYIVLRDENPEWIKALSQKDVLTIPANVLRGETIRNTETGPVFSRTASGHLHMRYSARAKNIIWKKKKPVHDALAFLTEFLSSDSEYINRRTLKAGEGIICRNILHRRNGYEDENKDKIQQRLLFRGRFYNELETTKTSPLDSDMIGKKAYVST